MKTNSIVSNVRHTDPVATSCHEILVPVDFSPASLEALRKAAALAEENHAHITVLNVVADQAIYRGQPVPATQKARELHRGTRIQELVSSAIHGIASDIVVCSGEPAEEICRVARHSHADLIVLGLHAEDEPHSFFEKHHPISRHVSAAAPCRVWLTGKAA